VQLHAKLQHVLHWVKLIGVRQACHGCGAWGILVSANAATHGVLGILILHQVSDQLGEGPLIVVKVITALSFEQFPKHGILGDKEALQREVPPAELTNWVGKM
jgi:hypothetical protein